MMIKFSRKPFWYLIFTFFAVNLLLYSSFGFWYREYSPGIAAQYPSSLTVIFTPETIDALNQDERLREAVISFTEAIAHSSTELGERFQVKGLRSFGLNLTDGIGHFRSTQQSELKKRDLLSDIGKAYKNIVGRAIGGAGGLNSTGGAQGLSSELKGLVMGGLSTPALFLGIGLGMGVSTSLNLTDTQQANAQAAKVATTYNASATGINLAARNFGTGLAGQLTPSFGKSNTSAAFALASGIGNATAMSFGLTQQRFAPSEDSGLEAIAGNFGLGIATPIVSKIKIRALITSLGGDETMSGFIQQLPQIAAAAGTGFGEGAKNALGIATTAQIPPGKNRRQGSNENGTSVNVPEAVVSFAKGLSQSFLQGSDLTKLTLMGGTNLTSMFDLQTMLRPIAAGAGAGIGMGVAIGLKLKSSDESPSYSGNLTGQDQQTAMVAEGFYQNLFLNLLANSTALEQASQLFSSNAPQIFKGIDPAKAAEGFGRGTLEGVMTAMSSVGGLKNLISGDIPADAMESIPVLQPTTFNDTLNGSAVAFARGLMGEGTILIAEIVRNMTRSSQNTNSTSSVPVRHRRDTSNVDVASTKTLSMRQTLANDTGLIFPAVDVSLAQMGAQKAIDALTCQGIGGLASAGLALMNSGESKSDKTQASAMLDPRVLQSLPDGPIELTSDGNHFQIIIKKASVEINGMKLLPFAVLTALHVVFAGFAFLTFLPLYMLLGVVWRFSVLAGHPVSEEKNRKWRLGFLITFGLLGIVGIVLGMIGMGNAKHFRDAHGIVGLITLILIIPTVGFSIVRLHTSIPHPPPAAFAGIKTAIALAKTPSRIYLISGIFTQLLLALGQFAFIQGFATLRSISLCIVDAILTSVSVAGLISILLMVQISATALAGFRAWLEQHVAKQEAAGMRTVTMLEADEKGPRVSIQTFGFGDKDAISRSGRAGTTLASPQRKTDELKGFEDVLIGTPFNVRKGDSISSPYYTQPYTSKMGDYNYSPGGYRDPSNIHGTYQGTLTGFTSNAMPNKSDVADRPSSDVIEPLVSLQLIDHTGPRTQYVTTADLFPPPPPPMQLTNKSVSSSYSRPFDGQPQDRDTFLGFGPGETVKERR